MGVCSLLVAFICCYSRGVSFALEFKRPLQNSQSLGIDLSEPPHPKPRIRQHTKSYILDYTSAAPQISHCSPNYSLQVIREARRR